MAARSPAAPPPTIRMSCSIVSRAVVLSREVWGTLYPVGTPSASLPAEANPEQVRGSPECRMLDRERFGVPFDVEFQLCPFGEQGYVGPRRLQGGPPGEAGDALLVDGKGQ